MSVKGCFRSGCNRIMCDRYSSKYGYICQECFEELVSMGPMADIKKFMESEKQVNSKEEAEARFNAVFK